MHTCLTIAGSDASGGAGIQADIKTMMANGVYAMSAITALTAQNTTGVRSIMNVTPEFLSDELDMICTDIFPDAVKIGMISERDLVLVIGEKLRQYQLHAIVLDPVMISSSGARLLKEDAVSAMKENLFPIVTLLTPNIPEAEYLTGVSIEEKNDMSTAAKRITAEYGCAVLLKGGHRLQDADDLLYTEEECHFFHGKHIDNPNTHGTGCTLSSAIAANLAKGFRLFEAVERAKEYTSGAIAAGLNLGHGSGPMNHAFSYTGRFMEEAQAFHL